MRRTVPLSARRGLTLLEVMIALVILGLISSVYLVTTRLSQKNTGKATDWQAESVAIDKTVERLRLIQSVDALRKSTTTTPWTDSTSKVAVDVWVKAGTPAAAACGNFCGGLAEIVITAKRRNFKDSVVVTTFLYAKNP